MLDEAIFSATQARLKAIYDPQRFRAAASRWAELLSTHLDNVQQRSTRVLNWAEPDANIAEAARWLNEAPLSNPNCEQGRSLPETSDSSLACDLSTGKASAIARAASHLEEERSPPSDTDRFASIVQQMLDRGHNLHHPHYIGHQVPAPVPIAGLFDAVGAVTNQVMAIYEMGPWATAVERALVNRLGEQIGWQRDNFAGLVTHGGSLGNLTVLLTARNVMLGGSWEDGVGFESDANRSPVFKNGASNPLTEDDNVKRSNGLKNRPTVIVQADAHYSVARAAGIIGLGTKQVLRAALNSHRQLDPQRLDEQITELKAKGHPVVAVSACACATPIGAFDPLRDVAAVCRKHGVWMHVDAAHGGAALMSRRYRHLLDGVDQADSVVWDAHKMMFVPALCAFVLYRDKRHRFETFRQDAPYLFDPSAPGMAEYDSGMLTLECTKRAAAYGLWGTWSLFGESLFEDLVDVTFDLGRVFYNKLLAADDFVPLHEPQCNIVAFRHVPTVMKDAPLEVIGAFQRELRRRVIESGKFYIVQTNLGGCGALRVTIINPLTTADDLDELLSTLREVGTELLKRG